ncbi:MAG: hypothetical protein JWM26_4094 [Betaproteobacteria bacterium]|jgi:hypothetical protein|nr:hypothetical protein [Betaproteobacteria bacterium]
MPTWLWPAVKLILPHVGNIVAAAKPAFTRKAGDPAQEPGVVQQQIAELQAAASQDAAHIKELAEQLRLTVAALEQGAVDTEKRIRRASAVAMSALVVAVLASVVALYAAVT